MLTPTIDFYTLGYDLKSHHPVVVNFPLLQLLLVEVQDEGQMVVQIKLRGTKEKEQDKNWYNSEIGADLSFYEQCID